MSSLLPMSIVVVPGWIYKTLIRNKISTRELMDYSKVRKSLSLDDMAQWFYMNDSFRIRDCRLSNTMLEHVWSNFTDKDQNEVSNSVIPLSVSEEVASDANYKLNQLEGNPTNLVSNQTYQFIRIENILYIVLFEGFMASMLDEGALSVYVKNHLKECYAMTSVKEVSELNIFNLYLKQFAI